MRSQPVGPLLTELHQDVATALDWPEQLDVLDRTLCWANDEFLPGSADGNDARDRLPTVEHDHGSASTYSLKVLAQVGLEGGDADGLHDLMIVIYGPDRNIHLGRKELPPVAGFVGKRPTGRRREHCADDADLQVVLVPLP